MTPRPLYRWKSLWLGLFVACSLAWAWQDSMRFSSVVSWREFRAINIGGAIVLTNFSRASVPGPGFSSKFEGRRARTPAMTGYYSLFAAPLLCRGDEMNRFDHEQLGEPEPYREKLKYFMLYRPHSDWLLFIPHWMILSVFVLPWLGFLIWRVGKQAKSIP